MTENKTSTEYPPNSLFHWYPLINNLDIPMPDTVMVPFPEGLIPLSILNGDDKEVLMDYVLLLLDNHEDSGFGLPFFLRTDETSNKHDWRNSCYVDNIDHMTYHVLNLMEFTEMAGWMGGLDINGFVLREFLDLDVRFTAFRGKMPVAKEFRFFVRAGEYQCHHPYWFPACMTEPSIDNWFDTLLDMEELDEEELSQLIEWSEKIGMEVGGYWSIDFCNLRDGSWAMTDMALAKDSFHFNTCKYAPDSMQTYPDPYSIPPALSEEEE